VNQRLFGLVLLLVSALSAGAASPSRIASFSSLMETLTKGTTVHVVVDYARCDLVEAGERRFAPARIGGLTVDSWRSHVDTTPGSESETVILTCQELVADPRGGMVVLHVELEVRHDDRVMVTLRHLAPDTHDVVSRWRLSTRLDTGKEGAAAFFRIQ
jgi:hypothetical protein